MARKKNSYVKNPYVTEVDKRAGKQLPGQEIESVTMHRSNYAIGTQTNYTDGTGYWDESRPKNYTSMPSKPVGGSAKSAKKTTKQTTSKPTTSKTSTAKKDDLKKTTKRTTTTKKTTKKR